MTREDAIKFAEYAQIMADGKPDVQEFYKLAESALRTQQELESKFRVFESNEPLTLDELRQMDGEPVYCVEITCREEWLFRRDGGFADMYGEFTSDDFMSWDNYGKLWWCYRRAGEEGKNGTD